MASKTFPNAPLTEKQKRFVKEYILDYNAYQAYLRAGYSANETTARAASSRLLKIDGVKEAIQKEKDKLNKKFEISQERVLEEDSRIAYNDPRAICNEDGSLVPLNKLPKEVALAVAGYKVTETVVKTTTKDDVTEEIISRRHQYKFWNKGSALRRLGEHTGAYKSDTQLNFLMIVKLSEMNEAERLEYKEFTEWKRQREIEKIRQEHEVQMIQ